MEKVLYCLNRVHCGIYNLFYITLTHWSKRGPFIELQIVDDELTNQSMCFALAML